LSPFNTAKQRFRHFRLWVLLTGIICLGGRVRTGPRKGPNRTAVVRIVAAVAFGCRQDWHLYSALTVAVSSLVSVCPLSGAGSDGFLDRNESRAEPAPSQASTVRGLLTCAVAHAVLSRMLLWWASDCTIAHHGTDKLRPDHHPFRARSLQSKPCFFRRPLINTNLSQASGTTSPAISAGNSNDCLRNRTP